MSRRQAANEPVLVRWRDCPVRVRVYVCVRVCVYIYIYMHACMHAVEHP